MTKIDWRWGAILVCLVLVLYAQQTQASTIAADSFLSGGNPAAGEYDTTLGFFDNGTIAQNPVVPGFSGAWDSVVTSGTGAWRPVTNGLEAPGMRQSAGGATLFQFNSDIGLRNVQRSLTNPPPATTGDVVWMSGLVQVDELDPNFNGYAFAGFASDVNNNNSTQGLRFGVQGDGSEMDLVFRHRNGSAVVASETLLDGISAGETYQVVIRASINTDNGGGGVLGNDNISLWVNPGGTQSEAALGAPTLMVEDFSIFNNDAFEFLTFEGSNITGAGVRFDELRLGTALESVVGPVPEPGTLGLISLLGLVGVVRRPRRRK